MGTATLKGPLRKTVRTLAAMLRLAEGLDRSHAQVVTALDVVPRGDAYLIRLRAAGDAELELWAAHRHGAELERVLQRPLRFEVSGRPAVRKAAKKKERASHAEQSHHAARVPRKAVRRGGNRRVGKNHPARAAGKVA